MVGEPRGAGVGLRGCHMAQVLEHGTDVPWFELLADNHLAAGGVGAARLAALVGGWPLTLHCVGMNLGGVDPLDRAYVEGIARLARRTGAAWVSDHLCFTACHGRHYHDLLPLPYTEQTLAHVAARVHEVQEQLGQPLVVENVSAYLRYRESVFDEAGFLAELAARTGCGILLDVNNLYVNHFNHGDDVTAYLDALPLGAVREIHLAGFQHQGDYLLDAHNGPVAAPVWALYEEVVRRLPDIPVLIEWDDHIPPFAVLREEARRAAVVAARHSAANPASVSHV